MLLWRDREAGGGGGGRDDDGGTGDGALLRAAQDVVDWLMTRREGPDALEILNCDGFTPLTLAARWEGRSKPPRSTSTCRLRVSGCTRLAMNLW